MTVKQQRAIRIILSGPESTAKSTLAKEISDYFKGQFIPEYAREYIQNLNRPYSYDDVLHIAQHQIEELKLAEELDVPCLIYDTGLIITKIWLQVKYNKVPDFIDQGLKMYPADYYLLCYPDIEWVPDPLRENRDARPELFNDYKDEIERLKIPYSIVRGKGADRLKNAVSSLEDFFNEKALITGF